MLHILKHTFIDVLKMVPFLFIAFLIIELFEHKLSKKNQKLVEKSGKFGPLVGSLLGAIPQCGFSVIGTNLYVTRIITLGTLISIYLSTSDEMLPILISHNVEVLTIVKIIGLKVLIGMFFGFLIDLVLRKKNYEEINYDICEEEHCHCESNILKSSVIHTLKTILFVFVILLVLNVVFEYFDETYLSKIFLKNSLFGPFVMSLIGLIPNCGSSVLITELYLNNAISFGSLMAGLLTGSGVALLVLFRTNKSLKNSLFVLGLVYFLGSISGFIIELLGRIF